MASEFGTLELFLSDSRLVLGIANNLRYQAIQRVFGVSREGANVLTLVVAASAAEIAYEGTRRVLRPVRIPRGDAAIGALALREGALSVAGPGVREIPYLGTLVAFAVAGGLAGPALRRLRAAEQRARAAEKRLRAQRIGRYVAARGNRG